MNTTVFNLAQLQVLEMMSFVDSPEALAELKKAISDYFAKQAQKDAYSGGYPFSISGDIRSVPS